MSMAVHLALLGHVLRKRRDYIKPGLSVCNGKGTAIRLLEETNKNLPGNLHKTNRKPKPTQTKLLRRLRLKLRKAEPHSNGAIV